MQVLWVEFLIRPEHIRSFEVAVAENAQVSRSTEPGCRQFDICRDLARPERFLLYELYDDDAAVLAHLHSAHFLAFNQATADWVERKTVGRFLRTAP